MTLTNNPIQEHKIGTQKLAASLKGNDIYFWLIRHGYFPESHVLPPCFQVTKYPSKPKRYFAIRKTKKGKTEFRVPIHDCVEVHFPKTELTDRTFGLIHPEIHNDIAYHISRNWKTIVKTLFSPQNRVVSYSFPIPVDTKNPGRIGYLRSGRMIYEFIGMADNDIASICYRYTHIVRTDIKSFYPSIYTHSIPWAIHGKTRIRKPKNRNDYNLVGNRLDKLFQNSSDGCTNGIPIGPVVSDIAAEIIASGIDLHFSKQLTDLKIDCQPIRFKDDYRILVSSEEDGGRVIKALQKSMLEYNHQLSDVKTDILKLPNGLFRDWVSMYHSIHPRKREKYFWKEFREIYLAVIRIDKACPGTGVIDRFLADMISKDGELKVDVKIENLQKVFSMLLMLATLRIKSFPKVIGIIESILRSPFGLIHQGEIVSYLEHYLKNLVIDEERNKYLISWIGYFLVSNDLMRLLSAKPACKDLITRTVLNNRCSVYNSCKEFKLFVGSRTISKKRTMLEHLDIFNPPRDL